MRLSFVIPTYNRPGLAIGLARQIRKQRINSEIIIVDQSDDMENLNEINRLNIKYLRDKKVNTSICKNIGLNKATGDVVFFFDDDIEITESTIESHLKEYSDPEVLGVAGRVLNDGESIPIKTNVTTGRANKYLTDFTNNFWGTKRQTTQFPYGCNMSFRRAILGKLGGFDEQIPPPGFEETDLGLRVTKLGKMVFSPEALVYHHKAKIGGTRMDKSLWFKNYYWTYGRLVARHVTFPSNMYSLFRLSVRTIKEDPGSLLSLLKGFVDFKINSGKQN